MGDENPTGICKPQILRNTSYIVTSEEVFVEGVVMIIFPKEMKFLYDHHRKGDEPWRKSPQVYVKPEGITSIVRSSGVYRLPPVKITIDTVGPTRRIVFPVTILSKRGSASLILIMPQKEIKKSTLLDRKRVDYARQKDLHSSTPSYRS
ncbi:unknown [Dialister sp. CAG:486]|nr:unknown [Dialister sp. CAG:486]